MEERRKSASRSTYSTYSPNLTLGSPSGMNIQAARSILSPPGSPKGQGEGLGQKCHQTEREEEKSPDDLRRKASEDPDIFQRTVISLTSLPWLPPSSLAATPLLGCRAHPFSILKGTAKAYSTAAVAVYKGVQWGRGRAGLTATWTHFQALREFGVEVVKQHMKSWSTSGPSETWAGRAQ